MRRVVGVWRPPQALDGKRTLVTYTYVHIAINLENRIRQLHLKASFYFFFVVISALVVKQTTSEQTVVHDLSIGLPYALDGLLQIRIMPWVERKVSVTHRVHGDVASASSIFAVCRTNDNESNSVASRRTDSVSE